MYINLCACADILSEASKDETNNAVSEDKNVPWVKKFGPKLFTEMPGNEDAVPYASLFAKEWNLRNNISAGKHFYDE